MIILQAHGRVHVAAPPSLVQTGQSKHTAAALGEQPALRTTLGLSEIRKTDESDDEAQKGGGAPGQLAVASVLPLALLTNTRSYGPQAV